MEKILVSHEEISRRAKELYENTIEQEVTSAENIGKMVIIDIETGDYEVDTDGLYAADLLNQRHSNPSLFGIRIGYNVAASLGGVMERVRQ
jgi:hypothetical protein